MGRLPDLPYNRTIADIIGEMRKPDIGIDTAWYRVGPSEAHGVNFTTIWDNVGGASNPDAAWYIAPDGEVRLRGLVTGGTDGTEIFTLPEEVRPDVSQTFIVGSDDTGQYRLEGIRFRAAYTATNFEELGP